MQLRSFRVTKFRNIVDSGDVDVDHLVTCLVGKNEAGKSGLLEALYLFNPAHGERLDVNEQYPKWLVVQDRRSGALEDHAPISVTFDLHPDDLAAVVAVLGENVLTGSVLKVDKTYSGATAWAFEWDEASAIANLVSELSPQVQPLVTGCTTLNALSGRLANTATDDEGPGPSAADLAAGRAIVAERGLNEVGVWERIVSLLRPQLPTFFRFTNYSTLPGRIDLAELASAAEEGPGRSGQQTARALLRLAGTDVGHLTDDTYELRRGELDAVQIDLTRQVFEYWKQNTELEVTIDVDKTTVEKSNGQTAVARYLDIRLRDKRTGYSNNFSQRSSGFQWFFSFLAAFSEFDGQASPIVLLDEPALTLHGRAQADFLRFINERLAPSSPVLYTSHSPFMVEPDKLERVRIVEDHGPPIGATVTADVLAADQDSLFPLQAALGYDIAQSLFIGPNNLVVEGTSDFIYFTVIGTACAATDRQSLDERWRLLPAGGATNIPTFVSLIGPHLDITVVADSDTKGMQRITSMVERDLLSGHRLIMVSAAAPSQNADTEDLFSEGDYLKLYNKTYGKSFKVSDLPPGDRIVKRLEALNGPFVHGEVAETLLRNHHEMPMTATTLDRFSTLFTKINATIET